MKENDRPITSYELEAMCETLTSMDKLLLKIRDKGGEEFNVVMTATGKFLVQNDYGQVRRLKKLKLGWDVISAKVVHAMEKWNRKISDE